jgi:hypothetical protein
MYYVSPWLFTRLRPGLSSVSVSSSSNLSLPASSRDPLSSARSPRKMRTSYDGMP